MKTTPLFPAYQRQQSLTAYVRLLLRACPGVSLRIAARIFDLSANRASAALKYAREVPKLRRKWTRRAELGPRAPRRATPIVEREAAPIAGSKPRALAPRSVGFFERGHGRRRTECERYEECLDAAARSAALASSPVRCPRGCASFVERDGAAELLHLAASRPGVVVSP
jgi:hypothetical protein